MQINEVLCRTNLMGIYKMYFRQSYIFFCLLMLMVFLFYSKSNVIPVHDSMYIYQFFHVFYSSLKYNHEPLLWLPYAGYGIPSLLLQLQLLNPSSYVIGLLGVLFQVKNTLILLKIAFFLNVSIYLMGVYLFVKSNLEFFASRFIVLTCAGLSLCWLWQPFFSLTIFYLFPLILNSITQYVKHRQVKWLFVGAALFMFNFIGEASYFVVLQFYTLLAFFIPLLISGHFPLKPLLCKKAWFSPQFLCLFFLALSLVLIVIHTGKHGVLNISPGRGPSFFVSKEIFLNFGVLPAHQILWGILGYAHPLGDNTFYNGLLPILLFGIGLFVVENIYFFGLFCAYIFLIVLSKAGFIAALIYYLPAMSLYRHLSLTYGLSGLILILASGFIMDHLLKYYRCDNFYFFTKDKYRKYKLILFFVLCADVYASWNHVWDWSQSMVPHNLSFLFLKLAMYFAIFVYFIVSIKSPRLKNQRLFSGILISVVLFDMLSFQIKALQSIGSSGPRIEANLFEVRPSKFYMQRLKQPQTNQTKALFKILKYENKKMGGALYAQTLYPFLDFDTCINKYRLDLIMRPSYIAALKMNALNSNDGLIHHKYASFLGCGAEKIKFFAKHQVGNNLLDIENPSETLLIDSAVEVPNIPVNTENNSISVNQFSANRLTLSVINNSDYPELLSYADAYHRHWSGYVDNHKIKITRANEGFKALVVPPGEHEIRFIFGFLEDWLASYGLIILSIFFIIFVGVVIYKQLITKTPNLSSFEIPLA